MPIERKEPGHIAVPDIAYYIRRMIDPFGELSDKKKLTISEVSRIRRFVATLMYLNEISSAKDRSNPNSLSKRFKAAAIRHWCLDGSQGDMLDSLQQELSTAFNMNDNAFPELLSTAKPHQTSELILPEAPKIIIDIRLVNQKILDRINRNPYEMYNLSARQFEIMCAELYEERGYKVILTQETRDGGKDLIILDDRDLGKFKIYGECKRYAPDNPVSVNVVKQLAGNIWADKVTAGIVMTSSYFSKDAKSFANQFEHQLSLMDFNYLHQMMVKH